MQQQTQSTNIGGIELEVGLQFHTIVDYDRKALRKAMREGAAQVRKEARRIVSRRAISIAGDFPGTRSGTLKRAIGVVGKGSKGGWIKVGVRKTDQMKDFYPAFLFYGSPSTGLAKRANFMETALQNKRDTVRSAIRAALKDSLVPR